MLSTRATLYYPGGTKHTLDYKSIIQVAGVIVNEKCDQMGPEICKKEGIFVLYTGNNYSEEEENDNWLSDAVKGEYSGSISHSLKRNVLWELL